MRHVAGWIGWLVVCVLVTAPAHAAPTPSFPRAPLGDESVAAGDDAGGLLVNPAAGGIRYPRQLLLVLGGPDTSSTGVLGIASAGGFGAWAGREPRREQQYGVGLGGGEPGMRAGLNTALRVSERTGEHLWDMRLGLLSRPTDTTNPPTRIMP